MKKVYLFRHGETNWNRNKDTKYCEEVHNVGLNELGIEQAKQNAISLKDSGIQHVYTSKLKRANETGKILAEFLNVGYEAVDGLEEFSMYDDSVIGLTRAEIKEKIGAENHSLCMNSKDELMDWRPLNCETKREARARIVNTVNNICKTTPYDVIGIASHGVIIRELLKACDFADFSKMKNCEVVEAEFDDGSIKILNRIKNDLFKHSEND